MPTLKWAGSDFDEYYEGQDIELRNRFWRIGHEYGTTAAKAMENLHRHDVGIKSESKHLDVGINVGISLTQAEEAAAQAILRNPRLTASKLGDAVGVTSRQAERILASLKKKANLRREGARTGKYVRQRQSRLVFCLRLR